MILIENFAMKMSADGDVWYVTNYEIYAYIEAANRLQYAASGDFVYNPAVIDIWIEVDKQVFKIPGGMQITLA